MNTATEYPPRHLPPFRPLVPGDPPWHRTDWTPDMLEDKDGRGPLRPLLLGEKPDCETEVFDPASSWYKLPKYDHGPATPREPHQRTRRPLPPPPPTFEHDGKTWTSHVPGDPCPVDRKVKVEVLTQKLTTYTAEHAWFLNWERVDHGTTIIGYRIPDAEPQDDTAKLRERIAELEQQLASLQTDYFFAEKATDNVMRILPELNQSPSWEDAANNVRKYIDGLEQQVKDLDWFSKQRDERIAELENALTESDDEGTKALLKISQLEQQLATALTPRPIEEAGPVKEGFVRFYLESRVHGWMGATFPEGDDTHFLDIRLPAPDPRAEYERAVAVAGGPFEAWLKTKGCEVSNLTCPRIDSRGYRCGCKTIQYWVSDKARWSYKHQRLSYEPWMTQAHCSKCGLKVETENNQTEFKWKDEQ